MTFRPSHSLAEPFITVRHASGLHGLSTCTRHALTGISLGSCKSMRPEGLSQYGLAALERPVGFKMPHHEHCMVSAGLP